VKNSPRAPLGPSVVLIEGMPFSGIAMDLQKSAPASNEICRSQILGILHHFQSLGKEVDYGWVNSVKPENVVASPVITLPDNDVQKTKTCKKPLLVESVGLRIMEVLVEYPTLALSGRVTTS
jgi:hypothetical protein